MDLINLGEELPLPAYYPDFSGVIKSVRQEKDAKGGDADFDEDAILERESDYIGALEKEHARIRPRSTLVHQIADTARKGKQGLNSYNYSMTSSNIAKPLFESQNIGASGDVGFSVGGGFGFGDDDVGADSIVREEEESEEEDDKWLSQQVG